MASKLKHGTSRISERISLDGQLELASGGFGRFQFIAVFAFICLYIADGMELLVANITWEVLPHEEWGLTKDQDYLRGVLVSASYFGFVIGALFAGFTGTHCLWLFHLWLYPSFCRNIMTIRH
jgi:hypothetical protein